MASSGNKGSVFDCPICLEKLKNPKYLPCLHTFCELCIQSFIDSSLSDSVINHKKISFDCPLCRRVNTPPVQNISAKEWAEQLPINDQLLAIQDSYKEKSISERAFICDSCIQNGEQIRAKLRCKQCRENLCETCCKFIHKRVKAFELHTIVELNSQNANIEITEPENCSVHIDKPIEVYCFDHGKVGCIFCLTTIHKQCDTVLSLDEIADRDLENSSKGFIRETKQMRDLTTFTIQDTKKNITELNKKTDGILSNVTKNIEDIKQRLDSLQSMFRDSLRNAHEKKASELTSTLNVLENFNAILEKTENIACPVMEREIRKQRFITKEKIKLQIYDQLKNIREKGNHMKISALTWKLADGLNRFHSLTKLGDFEYIMENNNFLTQIESHYNVLENERVQRKKDSIRILQGISIDYTMSTDTKLLAAAFDLRNSSWSCAFSPRGSWSDIRTINWYQCSMEYNMSNTLPASLLLNPDKTFRAFGYEAREQFYYLEYEQKMKFYFFQDITSVLYSQKTMNPQQTTQDDITGKKIETVTIWERALNFLLKEFTKSFYYEWRVLDLLETDVKCVIILPTYFSENIQQFVYETAVKSGFPRSSLFIVLEAEAAFFYYQCKETKGYEKDMEVHVGKKYLVACLGEKTSTLTVHKKSDDGTSDEILRISKGCWGMQSLLDEFETCLEEIIGKQQIQDIKTNLSSDYKNLTEEFGSQLKTMRDGQTVQIRVSIARDIVQWIEDHSKSSIRDTFSFSEYSERIKIRNNYRMIWSKEAILQLFDKTIKGIIEHIKTILDSDMVDIETILLFGSLSECIVIQNAVKEFFNTKRVVALHENAVLYGAVHIRHAIDCQDC